MNVKILSIRNFLGLDSAVLYYLLLRVLQVIGGVGIIFFIAKYYTEEMQGFYYIFSSLIAIQTFLELGLYIVITTYASHQWSSLEMKNSQIIFGNLEAFGNLASLVRFVLKWYSVATIIFVIIIGLIGFLFIDRIKTNSLSWEIPWILHVSFSALSFFCLPFLCILEGCDQIARIAKFKCFHIFSGNIIFWVALAHGAGMWAIPIYSGFLASAVLGYIVFTWGGFFGNFLFTKHSSSFNWKNDVLPMQWRLALQGLVNYFGWALFPLVLTTYHGPELAGRMGMSQQIVMSMVSLAMVWTATKVPKFGMLISKRNFKELDELWFSSAIQSTSVMTIGAALVYGCIVIGDMLEIEITKRVIDHKAFGILLLGAVFATKVQCFALYLRAYKIEVLTIPSLICSIAIGLFSWRLGIIFKDLGIVAVYFCVTALLMFPTTLIIWRIKKQKFQNGF